MPRGDGTGPRGLGPQATQNGWSNANQGKKGMRGTRCGSGQGNGRGICGQTLTNESTSEVGMLRAQVRRLEAELKEMQQRTVPDGNA